MKNVSFTNQSRRPPALPRFLRRLSGCCSSSVRLPSSFGAATGPDELLRMRQARPPQQLPAPVFVFRDVLFFGRFFVSSLPRQSTSTSASLPPCSRLPKSPPCTGNCPSPSRTCPASDRSARSPETRSCRRTWQHSPFSAFLFFPFLSYARVSLRQSQMASYPRHVPRPWQSARQETRQETSSAAKGPGTCRVPRLSLRLGHGRLPPTVSCALDERSLPLTTAGLRVRHRLHEPAKDVHKFDCLIRKIQSFTPKLSFFLFLPWRTLLSTREWTRRAAKYCWPSERAADCSLAAQTARTPERAPEAPDRPEHKRQSLLVAVWRWKQRRKWWER